MELLKRTFIVTGAGTGIGRATAIQLARGGANVVLVGRRASPLEETCDLVTAAGGVGLIVQADVGDPNTHREILDQTLFVFERINGLINNAGNVRAGRLESISEAEVLAQLRVNLFAPILLTRAALPEIKQSNEGVVVNISSGVALVGVPFYSVYAAAKGGLAAFGASLRRELLGEAVNVLTVFPSATDTAMMQTNLAGADLGFSRESPEAVAEAIVAAIRSDAREVIRGGDVRAAMIAANRDRPQDVDNRFAAIKDALEAAVSGHRHI
jgi:short-subunit dehydrogenase